MSSHALTANLVRVFVLTGLFCLPLKTSHGQALQATNDESFASVLAKSETAFNRRAELLQHSTGRAHLKVVRSGGEKLLEKLGRQMKETEFDSERVETSGGNTMDVRWYMKADHLRYDLDIGRADAYKPWRTLGVLRIAANKEVGIYYSPQDKRAYVNQPPSMTSDLSAYLDYFDPRRMYCEGYDLDPYKGLRQLLHERDRMVTSLVSEEHDGTPSIHVTIENRLERARAGSYSDLKKDMWFALEQELALLQDITRITEYNRDKIWEVLEFDFHAQYQECQEFEDVWLLKSLHRREVTYCTQELWVDFSDVHLGVDVPDVTFNYDGLGVPQGVQIFDRRAAGPSKIYYYVPGVYVGLDRIDLAAGAAAPADLPKSACPEAKPD